MKITRGTYYRRLRILICYFKQCPPNSPKGPLSSAEPLHGELRQSAIHRTVGYSTVDQHYWTDRGMSGWSYTTCWRCRATDGTRSFCSYCSSHRWIIDSTAMPQSCPIWPSTSATPTHNPPALKHWFLMMQLIDFSLSFHLVLSVYLSLYLPLFSSLPLPPPPPLFQYHPSYLYLTISPRPSVAPIPFLSLTFSLFIAPFISLSLFLLLSLYFISHSSSLCWSLTPLCCTHNYKVVSAAAILGQSGLLSPHMTSSLQPSLLRSAPRPLVVMGFFLLCVWCRWGDTLSELNIHFHDRSFEVRAGERERSEGKCELVCEIVKYEQQHKH